MNEGIKESLSDYRQIAESKEEGTLFSKAAFSRNHSRLDGIEDDHRLSYKRDVDRIVHSKAYARYIDKTQVVYLVENDHVTHRGLHVQLVSNFARGIGEILRLNLDLVEAIALGHDVGHPPFGHEGEGYLSELSIEYGNGVFAHPWQSCRLFTLIEPLNLGLSVYDGFLCHDGGLRSTKLTPRFDKSWEDHFDDLKTKVKTPDADIIPGSLEGCLVKMCDTMSYVGRDIEDAISLGIIDPSSIPKTILGTRNREILSVLAKDIIKQSYEKGYIALSEQAHEALRTLRDFNFKEIYNHPSLKVESGKVRRSYRIMFEWLLNDWNENEKESFIWNNFLHNKSEKYLMESTPVQRVVDYISGMTDSYFVRVIEEVMVPRRIHL